MVGGELGQIDIVANVGLGGLSGGRGGYIDGDLVADFVNAGFGGGVPNGVFPDAGALVGAGNPDYAPELDFNGLPANNPPDVGAYAYRPRGNPGWTLQAGFKEFPDIDEGETDGGTTGDTGGDDDGSTSIGGGDESSDAGTDSGGGSTGGSDGGGGDASGGEGSSGPGADADDGDGGCSCRTDEGSGPLGLFALVMFGAVTRRRRQR